MSGLTADARTLIDHARVEAQHHWFTYNERIPVDGPVLFNTDPSGTYTKYLAAAIGSAQEGATSMLQEQYNKDMTLAEAEVMALTVLRQVMEEKLSKINVEVAKVPLSTGLFTAYTVDELETIIERL